MTTTRFPEAETPAPPHFCVPKPMAGLVLADLTVAARTVWGEARNRGYEGMLAVAWVSGPSSLADCPAIAYSRLREMGSGEPRLRGCIGRVPGPMQFDACVPQRHDNLMLDRVLMPD